MIRALVLISILVVAIAAQTTGQPPTGKCCRWCRQSLFNITNVQECAIRDQEECFTWKTDRFVCSNTSTPEASWHQNVSCPCLFEACCIGCVNFTATIPPFRFVEADVCHNTEFFDCQGKSSERQCPPGTGSFLVTNCTLCANATVPQCSDGIDNDNDTFIDFPADPECDDSFDNDESNGVVTTGSPPPEEQNNGETTLIIILAIVFGVACLFVCCCGLLRLWMQQQQGSNGVYYQAVPGQNASPVATPYYPPSHYQQYQR